MRNKSILLLLGCFFLPGQAQERMKVFAESSLVHNRLPGFVTSPYWGEQEMDFAYAPGMNIHINAPAEAIFDKHKPTRLVLYALPNGNSIDWTIGKMPAVGDDWHYYIQHIGAQTRFVRSIDKEYNLVTVYLEADTRSWGSWRKAEPLRDFKIKEVVEYLLSLFSEYSPFVELNCHSGGGNFVFGFMDASPQIPVYVKRISFIDSNYNWDNERYGDKLKYWLEASKDNSLFVACYDDANALLNGKPFISKKGGTWHRTHMMQQYLRKSMKQLAWNKIETDSTISITAQNRRIQFYSRKNPEQKIYHTILVERNGFIQSVLFGTEQEGRSFQFMGKSVYDAYRQDSIVKPHPFRFPPRKAEAMSGSEFVHRVKGMTAEALDSVIYREIAQGNIPDALRQSEFLTDSLWDSKGKRHGITFCVLPDFLAIGTDSDFIHISMLPQTAQRLADLYGAILPTRKLSDFICRHNAPKSPSHSMKPDSIMKTAPVRLIRDEVLVDGKLCSLKALLQDAVLYKLFSDERCPM